jgi:hypothetical protein
MPSLSSPKLRMPLLVCDSSKDRCSNLFPTQLDIHQELAISFTFSEKLSIQSVLAPQTREESEKDKRSCWLVALARLEGYQSFFAEIEWIRLCPVYHRLLFPLRSSPPSVYATVPRDHETKRRLQTVELQRFQLTPSQRNWTIDRTAGSQCEVEDCIFLRRIQELRDKADDKDEGLCWTKRTAANIWPLACFVFFNRLRCWSLEQMKLY